MMMKNSFTLLLMGLCLMAATSCKKTATYTSPAISSYIQLQPGKYITYRLDSLEFVNFGLQQVTVSYLAKDIVDTVITDNLGRPTWRVIRYLSDTTGTQPWLAVETYMVTPTPTTLEVVENNLRYIKLVLPITNGYSWPGNSYIDATSDTFNVVTYLQGWNYAYDSVGSPYSTPFGVVPNSLVVHQEPYTVLGSPNDPTSFSSVTFSTEVYGQNIGLIYKNFLYQEYQPPNGNTVIGSTSGYGLTLRMVDHN